MVQQDMVSEQAEHIHYSDRLASHLVRGTKLMELIEYERIATSIEQYAQGAIEGKSAIMRQSFHPAAQIYGHLDGDVMADPIQAL